MKTSAAEGIVQFTCADVGSQGGRRSGPWANHSHDPHLNVFFFLVNIRNVETSSAAPLVLYS